jgi:hypothetical protein
MPLPTDYTVPVTVPDAHRTLQKKAAFRKARRFGNRRTVDANRGHAQGSAIFAATLCCGRATSSFSDDATAESGNRSNAGSSRAASNELPCYGTMYNGWSIANMLRSHLRQR